MRRWFRKVWDVRGGGLYAAGYIIAFLWFEVSTLAGEIAGASGVGDFFSNQLTDFILRFAIDSIMNMVHAFMWPVYIIQWQPAYGGIILGMAFWLFPIYLKKPIEKLLFDDDDDVSRTN